MYSLVNNTGLAVAGAAFLGLGGKALLQAQCDVSPFANVTQNQQIEHFFTVLEELLQKISKKKP